MSRTSHSLTVLLSLLLVLTLAGCGSTPAEPQSAPAASQGASIPTDGLPEVEVDLTQLSSTMVYSEVYNLMLAPETYAGKTMRMRGQFTVYEDPDANANYYYVVIADATACCQQGLEFIWSGDHTYPEDYPPDGSEILVTGVFTPYEVGGITWYHLVCDEILF